MKLKTYHIAVVLLLSILLKVCNESARSLSGSLTVTGHCLLES